jgi:hypothetical protein
MSEADDFNAQAAALSPPGSPGPGRQPDVSPEELARQFPGEDENNGSPEYAARVAALAAQYNSPAAAEARKHVTPATGLREGLEGIPGAADRIKGPAQARPAAFDMDSAVAAMSAPVADVSQNPGKVDTSSTARSQDSDSDTSGFDMGAAAAAMEPPPEPAKPFDPAEGMSEAEKGAASGVSQVMQLPSALKLLGASMQHSAAARTIKQFDDLDSGVPWEKTDDVKKGYANPFTRMYAGADPDQKAELRQNMVDELTSSKANQQAAATTWLAYAKEQQGLRGRVPSLQDVRDVKGFGAWLANKGVSNAISLAPIIAASAIPVVGPALGGAGIVAQTVAGEAGRYAGAGAAANPENPEAGAASGVEQNVPRIATAGAVNSALNFAGPVGRFATGAAPAVGGVIRRAATGAAEQGAIGAAQTAVSDVAAGKTPDLAEIGEAGLLGAVVGGPLGAMHRAQKETLQNIATADDPVAAALAGTRSHDAAFAELTSNLADTLNTHLAPDVPQLEYKQKTDGEVLDATGLPPRGEGEGQLPAPEPQPLLPHYTSAPEQINATGFDHEAAAAAMEGAHGDQELQPPEPLPRPEPAEPHGMEALAPQTEQGGMAAPDITKPLESRGQREPGTLYAGPGGRDVEAVGIHQLPERTASQPVEGVSRGDAQAAQQMLRAIGKRLQVFKGDNAFFDPKDPNTIHVGDGVKAPILAVVGHEIKHVIDSHFPELSKAFDDELRSHLTPEQAEAFKSETHTPEEIAATKPGELHENYGFNEFSSDTFGAMWQNKNFFSDVFARARELGVEDRFPGTLGKVGALIVRLTRTMMKGLKAPSGNERFASVDGLRNVQSLHDKAVDAMARYYKEQQRPAREMESQRLRDAHEVSRIPLSTRRELHPSITRKDNGKPNGNEQQAGASAQGGRGQDVLRNAQTGNELQGDAGQDQNRVADARPLSSRPEREDSESVKPLEGSPPGNKPSAAIREVARKYMADAGLPYDPPTRYAKVDPARAKRVADAYEAMKHNPNDPEVKSAYEALARETIAQYDAMTKAGVKVDFMKPGENPYPNPRRAINDLHENNHLSVYPTESGFGTEGAPDRSDNPLLADSGRTIGGKPAAVNDLFRAVHDYFGHAKEGVGFRADGEENAWRMHSAMFSPEARRAMTSETRGQNSWVNYGSHGEFNKTASQEATKYADQKTGLLPKWASEDGVKESRAGKAPPKPAGEKLREDIDFTTNGVNHLANQRALLDADGLSWAHENTLYSHDSSLPSGVGANASYNVRTGRYEIRVRPGYINEAPPGELAMTLYHEHMHVIDWNGNLYSDHPQFDPAKEGTAARELVDLYNKTSDRELKQFLRYPLNDLAHPGMHTAGNEWKLRAELFAQAATLNNHPRYSEILQNEAPAAKKFLDAAIAHAAELGHIPGTDSTTEQARLAKSFDQRLRSVSKGAAGNDVQRSPAGNAGDGKGLLESRADRHDRIEKATSLTPILKGDEAVPKLKTLRDVGDYLDKRASKLLRGLDLSRDTPENRTAIAATIHGEASEALKQEGHAGEW